MPGVEPSARTRVPGGLRPAPGASARPLGGPPTCPRRRDAAMRCRRHQETGPHQPRASMTTWQTHVVVTMWREPRGDEDTEPYTPRPRPLDAHHPLPTHPAVFIDRPFLVWLDCSKSIYASTPSTARLISALEISPLYIALRTVYTSLKGKHRRSVPNRTVPDRALISHVRRQTDEQRLTEPHGDHCTSG
jgi:hypothetical protein